MSEDIIRNRILQLPLWPEAPSITPLTGGITNLNFLIKCQGKKYVVRSGLDIPEHHVMRFNELAASKAAYRAGLSPEVIYHEDGLTVLDYIESTTLDANTVRKSENLPRVAALIKQCHVELTSRLQGPALSFWVFHVIRDYAHTLQQTNSPHKSKLKELVDIGNKLELDAGPYQLSYCHNDLLAANFLDDGSRLWLIDWDYAGFNSPLFDLGGLASNNEFSPEQEAQLLELYYEREPSAQLLKQFGAMKCASLLRETMWSMVSEEFSTLDFDYSSYTTTNMQRFESAIQNHLRN